MFRHELGALYVACLLREPPGEPVHGVALALHSREKLGQPAGPAELVQQRVMGLEDAASVRALWRRQRELERVLADPLEIEPVKAEAQCELEAVTEHLRQSPWLSRRGAERCARAVAVAIKRLHTRLATAVDAGGRPDEVLRAFALHLGKHLLIPSGQGCGHIGKCVASVPTGCFTYEPPTGVVWEVQSPACGVQCPKSELQSLEPAKSKGSRVESKVLTPMGGVQSPKSNVQSRADRRPAAVERLASFLAVWFALALLATGCAGPRPLKGGKAVTTRKPAGTVEQTLVQGENPSQASKQTQESVKVRTYTLPAGSRMEQSLNADCGVRNAEGRKA